MAKKPVVWTALALKQRREILTYWTKRNNSSAYAEKLLKLIAVRTRAIAKHSESYKLTVYTDTRVSAMGHFSILYTIADNQIIVTAFWDNRQDPKKLLKIIKQ